ncbi:CoA ester lyase [Neorhizobium galegae]|uniref:HpcH/HpaI aldolase/citrate lyase family protein n=1 Tax=Neorhizobium galegae TaxID=399 RepID=UPI00126E16BC|nr:aldolase/citrate lyase family protein [Neorhizobium galegae]KAA9384105.1 hypothetical protein F4V88_28170 [Neorhizobium galegae]MCM2498754.1 aldolase/citrate lyase family protein [Neorhizobium galegae]
MALTDTAPRRSLRRSKLVIKGGVWDKIVAAHASGADIIHLELEAGFAESDRDKAVRATRRALEELDWSKQEAWVRFRHISDKDTATEIEYILAGRPQLVYCAKVRSAQDVQQLGDVVDRYEQELGLVANSTQIGAVIERVEALDDIKAIATATPRMSAIMFGANDMSISFGYRRTGIAGIDHETLYIRSRMVFAARLARIDVLDAAFMDRTDIAGGDADAVFSARLGFTGKTAIAAEQVEGIHRAFIPTRKELDWAHEVIAAAEHEDEAQRLLDGEPLHSSDIGRAKVLLERAS